MQHGDVRPEIAMVSRIRVEVRGESLKAVEEVAFAALDHARLAGVLEGYVPTSGSYTDHFFNRPEVTQGPSDAPEPWGELGLPYYGRLSFTFERMASYGGLAQFGYAVTPEADTERLPGSADHGFIVLSRQRPVQRERGEESPLGDRLDETGESILADIRTIRAVRYAKASIEVDNSAVVKVAVEGLEDVEAIGTTLREAAAVARRRVIDALRAADPPVVIIER